MNLTLFLPHTQKDTGNLLRLLDWINELGGAKRNRAIILSDCRVPQPVRDRLEKKAQPLFAGVAMAATSMALGEETYPIGPNWMFESALKEATKRELPSFLWLEPDCVPTRESWLSDIEGMFARCGKPYMGHVAPGPNGMQTLGRIACFAMPAAKTLMRYTAGSKKTLWNHKAGAEIAALAHNTQLIISSGTGIKAINHLPRVCALYHSDKSGALMRMIREQRAVEASAPPPELKKSTSEMLAEFNDAPLATTPTPSTSELLAQLAQEENA
jgi:hypothetical protein